MPASLGEMWKKDTTQMDDEELFEYFEELLRYHDWYYDYSDDQSVWQVGCAQKSKIRKLRQQLTEIDRLRMLSLFDNHCPWSENNE